MYAVLVPLVKTENGEAMLLEVRSEKVKQPGEICFPGGRVESGETVVQAAVRETCEELGVDPADIEVMSELDTLTMDDGREVHVVSAWLDISEVESLRLSEDEVSEVFLLPLDWLRRNPPVHYELAGTPKDELPDKLLGYLSHYYIDYRDERKTDWIEFEGHGIWGLTAKIIKKHISSDYLH
jgi:8-oxo-dGTP pyrophosphatase MutT (NUDIX family)